MHTRVDFVVLLLAGALACGRAAPPRALRSPPTSPATTTVPTPGATTAGRTPERRQGLAVSGKQITYRGAPIRIRGIALGGILDYDSYDRDAAADYRTMASEWKANAVRISVHPGEWKGQKGDALTSITRHVRAALGAGLFPIVVWHVIGFPDGHFEDAPSPESPPDTYDSSFALARDFWTSVSSTVVDDRVMFELWNEPMDKGDEEGTGGPDWTRLKPFWEQLTALIRANRSPSLILASGKTWAYDLRGIKRNLLADPNTAYDWHVYAGHDDNDPSAWAANLDAVQEVRPLVVTEWGFEPGSTAHYGGTAESFGVKFRDQFLEGRALHSTAWAWIPDYGPPLLKPDWSTRTASGELVYAYLRATNTAPARP